MTIFRPVTHQDFFQLAALIEQDAGWVKSVSTRIKKDKCTAIYVAEQDGCPVGFNIVRIVHRGRRAANGRLKKTGHRIFHLSDSEPDTIVQPTQFGFIENVFVVPALRRQGVATDLVQSSDQWLQQRAVNETQTAVKLNNAAARGFFSKLGFEPIRILVSRRLAETEQFSMHGIRPAVHGDLHHLSELVRREIEYQQKLANSFQLIPRVDWAAYLAARLQRSDMEILVAEKNGHLMGYIEIRFVQHRQGYRGWRRKAMMRTVSRLFRKNQESSSAQPNKIGFIEDIYVEPSMRKRSIGSGLLKSSLGWFIEKGIHEIEAAIWFGNKASQNFVRKLGFEPISLMMRKKR